MIILWSEVCSREVHGDRYSWWRMMFKISYILTTVLLVDLGITCIFLSWTGELDLKVNPKNGITGLNIINWHKTRIDIIKMATWILLNLPGLFCSIMFCRQSVCASLIRQTSITARNSRDLNDVKVYSTKRTTCWVSLSLFFSVLFLLLNTFCFKLAVSELLV